MLKKIYLFLFTIQAIGLFGQNSNHLFRIRTITAGVTLKSISDTTTLLTAIDLLQKAKKEYATKGYEIQTLRIATQNFYDYIGKYSYDEALPFLEKLDAVVKRKGLILSIGQITPPDKNEPVIAEWAEKLIQRTSTISFSISISSHQRGIHFNSIKAGAEIISALSKHNGGEANFRFAASANCPAGIPFFPAAFHEGKNSFAIGLEFPNLLTEAFKNANTTNARQVLKSVLEKNFIPVQQLAQSIAKKLQWQYDGIDASPAPGLDASIGEAIETYSKQPFGSPATLNACSLITDVLKDLNIKKCGYSGLMLPVIEDKVLAQRATEGRFTLQELLLYSSVSGTGLDVVPLPGDTPQSVLENILTDVAALSLKYTSKALSARLFLIPGKKAGDIATFENPYLTSSIVMKAY